MKNNDYWEKFSKTGKVNDYLNYIACTREEIDSELLVMGKDEESDIRAGIDYGDGDGSIGHAGC